MQRKKKQKRPKRKCRSASYTKKKIKYAGEEFASYAERDFAVDMDLKKIPWMYEPEKLEYWPPPIKKKVYTPDFKVRRKDGSSFLVEYKGYLRPGDKTKMRLIRKQYPDLDIRFVFQNAYKFISKHVRVDGTRQMYHEWATTNGYKWAHGEMPDEWLTEKLED